MNHSLQVYTYIHIYTDYNLKIILSGHSWEAVLAKHTAQKQSSAHDVDMLLHHLCMITVNKYHHYLQ